ncbi:MAG: AAA family ATPase [Candidatus Thiodiazotropha sp.]
MFVYKELETLFAQGALRVKRSRDKDGNSVVLKGLTIDASAEAIRRLRHEYEVLKKIELPGVIRTLGIEEVDGGLTLLLEDIGGESLERIVLSNTPFTIEQSLELAIGLAETLAYLHQQRIVHKAINPAHIIVNVTNAEFRLTGFGFSDELPQSGVALQPPTAIEGNLAYISPEQTGRMNRRVDYRSDFYSLGVTLYRILTGRLPFKVSDALGMVHCHIAKTAVSPYELNPDIPEMVSNIVMKLMAKMADNRYQSAWGLKADLEKCLNELRDGKRLHRFELGVEDFSDRLRIPQKLYGRDKEIAQLGEAFNSVVTGTGGLFLVAGYPGIGKTSLVHETLRLIVEKRGSFIEGKFDQLQRNVPYFAWIQAFKVLFDNLLMESEERLEEWKQTMLCSLDSMGRILTDVIPNLELIIGPQPQVPILRAKEAQNRFNYLFIEFIKALATQEHPLLIFLDDLQWIDAASLNLLQMIMSRNGLSHILVVGAYRDNEVDASHPLSMTIEALRAQDAKIDSLILEKISEESVNELISDTLHRDRSETTSLTQLLYSRTGGNPFFLFQTLITLTESQAITFDIKSRRWKWNMSALKKMKFTDSVIELMSQKVCKISRSARLILQQAACIGARFTLETLSIICNKTVDTILTELQPAFDEMLIISSGPDIEFAHDRVQQAVYSLIAEKERAAIHWRIGKLLLNEPSQRKRNEHFFDTVNHLIIGAQSFATSQEKETLVEMICQAGRKAKTSAAFASALEYFEAALNLLGETRWEERYQTMLMLHQEASETACLCGRYDRMKALVEVTHQQAKSLLDEIPTYETEIRALTAQGELLPAIRHGLTVLDRLGMRLPEEPSVREQEEHMATTLGLLQATTIEGLGDLPIMTSPIQLACTRVFSELGEPAYAASPRFFLVWASLMAELSLRYGNCALSPFAYAAYALALCAIGEHVETGSRLAKAAISMLEQVGAQSLRCRLLNIYGCTIQPWTEALRNTLPTLQDAVNSGATSGDFTSASYAAFNSCTAAFFMGEPLDLLIQRMQSNLNVIADMNQSYIWNWIAFHLITIQRLHGIADRSCELETFNNEQWLASAKQANDQCGLAYYFLNRLIEDYLLGESRSGQALIHLTEVEANQTGFQGAFAVPVLYFYGSLVRLDYSNEEATSLLNEIREKRGKLAELAHLAPMNFQHKCDLISAEIARIEGNQWQAAGLYEKAIAGAQNNGFLTEEALCCERAARFYLENDMETAGELHMRKALERFARWQAWEKVRALQAKHPQWLAQKLEPYPVKALNSLDLSTVMKVTHTISSEMEMDKLLNAAIRMVIENAGAQRGFLLLETDEKWILAAKGETGKTEITISQSLGIDESDAVSLSVIRFVIRTKQRIVLNDAANQGEFTNDSYIRREKTKSLLCTPLSSRGKLIGILYLENNLTTHSFTAERIQLLEMLLTQVAISLENARIYEILRKSQEKYRRIFETTSEGIWEQNEDFKTIYVNERMADMMGYRVKDIEGRPVTDFMFKEDISDYLLKTENRRKGDAEVDECRFIKQDGTTLWTLLSVTPVIDGGRFIGLYTMHTDITERKQTEAALQQSEELLSASQHLAKMGGWEFDVKLGKSFWSEELYHIHEIPKDPTIDQIEESLNCYRIEDRSSVMAAFKKVCENGEPYDLEFPFTTYKGKHLWIRTIAQPVYEQGQVVRVIGSLMDITDRKQIEEELLRYKAQLEEKVKQRTAELLLARDAAEEANRAKSMFLANMSHELRTPLNAILGFSSMMQQEPLLTDGQRQKLDIINRSGDHLLTLINDVLEIARIEAGRVQIENKPFDLGDMVRDVTDMMRVRAEERALQLQIEQASLVPRYIIGDEARLRQILINLMGNAIKFTQQGGVTLRLGVKDNKTSHLLIEVEDSGIGIAPEKRQYIFKPFVQLSGQSGGKGTGLGLTITKQFVQMMGGSIKLESVLGKGSLFKIELPLNNAKESDIIKLVKAERRRVIQLAPGQPEYRILIVEDQRENQLLLEELLVSIGFQVKIAKSGAQGVELFRSWHPHFIWMDRRMPKMDGMEATQHIRKLAGGKQVKIVAVTASAFAEQRDEMIAAGVDDFVRKPFSAADIYDCLSKHLGVKYLYQSTPKVQEQNIIITSEMLDALPEQLLYELDRALNSLDSEQIKSIIQQCAIHDHVLAEKLSQLADNFNYPAILRILSKES